MSECAHCGDDADNYCDLCETSFCDDCGCRCNDDGNGDGS